MMAMTLKLIVAGVREDSREVREGSEEEWGAGAVFSLRGDGGDLVVGVRAELVRHGDVSVRAVWTGAEKI